jgi:hypothetical protein
MVCEICDKAIEKDKTLDNFLEKWEKELRVLDLYEIAERTKTEKDMLILMALCRLLKG